MNKCLFSNRIALSERTRDNPFLNAWHGDTAQAIVLRIMDMVAKAEGLASAKDLVHVHMSRVLCTSPTNTSYETTNWTEQWRACNRWRGVM